MTDTTIQRKTLIYKQLLLILFLLTNIYSFSQRTVRSKGTAKVKIEVNKTEEETIAIAKEQAMIKAIENAFGTYIESVSVTTVNDKRSNFHYIGTTKVKGEWIKTLSEDMPRKLFQTTELGTDVWIEYTITGRVREIISNKANIQFEILNCPQIECRTTSFYADEQLYIYFKSPIDGYISIFIDEGEITRRLLPYSGMINDYQSGVQVKGDTDYIFFSESLNSFPRYVVDEIELYTNSQKEYNTVYIIFSEEKFVKPILNSSEIVNDKILPKSMNSKDFQKWLSDCRASIQSFQVVNMEIVIQTK